MKTPRSSSRLVTAIAAAAACLAAQSAGAAPALDRHLSSPTRAAAPPVLLFFEPGSAELPPSARPIANRALAEGIEDDRWQLRVEAYSPADGGDGARALAEQRARNVAALLAANGIPNWRIETGAVKQAERLDPVFSVAGERVEIRFRRASPPPLVADTR